MLQELEWVSLEIAYTPQGVVAKLTGVLSLTTSADLKHKVLELLAEGVKSVSLEISEIRHIDSVGLATLIVLARNCAERGVAFSLLRPAEIQDRLLRSTGLAKYLNVP